MKHNRWKKRLSLLIVALMLFTTLAPVALAVGEPETVTEVTEPAESDKVSEDQNEAPTPAEEKPKVEPGTKDENPAVEPGQVEGETPEISEEPEPEAVQAGANGTEITFVTKSGSIFWKVTKEVTRNFANDADELGTNKTTLRFGRGPFSEYFIGWSENRDYIKNGKGHLFYDTHTFKDVQDAGLIRPGETLKLHALYAGSTIASSVTKGTNVRINDTVSPEDFVAPGNPVRDENNPDRTIATYKRADGDYKIKKLDAVFTMNPFVAAAIYKDPWVGALENGSTWTELNRRKGNITVVDLHVELDPRIELPEEFDLTFTGYVFRPYQFYSAVHADGTEVAEDQDYPYLGADRVGDDPGYGILNRIEKNNPSTTFRVKSYVTDPTGKKVPVHKFVLRTRIRVGYDKYGNKIVPATMEQIQSDMHLMFTAKNGEVFTVTSAVAKAIAEENEKATPRSDNALFIRGFVDGLVKGRKFNKIESEYELLDFVNGETPKPPVVRHQIVQVEKIWDDKDDEAKKRPDFVTVQLFADGKDTKKYLTLRAEDDWKGAFRGLPFSENGKMIRYTVEEIPVKDYTSVVTANANGYVITNTFVPEKVTPEIKPTPTPEMRMPILPRIESPIVIPTIPRAGIGR